MSITDELREWKGNINTDLHPETVLALRSELNRIADRIDAEHEKAITAAHSNGITKYGSMVAREYVKLPVDADGVPIRIGDVLDEIAAATYPFVPAKVVGYHECCGEVLPIVENDGEFQVIPEKVCHYHAPTVEDVLREFAEKITDSQIPNVHPTYEEAIAEYAAKLRLAGDE